LGGDLDRIRFIDGFFRETWCCANWPLGIARHERKINALVYALYNLSAEEIEMVEKG
jgi:hypothetical protein